MTKPDQLYLALIAIGPFLDSFVLWPAFVRHSQVNPGRARIWLCLGVMSLLWALVAAGVVLWLVEGRAWGLLRFTVPRGWQLWVAVCLVWALVVAHLPTIAKITHSKRPKRFRMPDHATKMAPRTGSELGWWVVLSLSAGFCEEFLFRGYLIWVLQPLLGLWGAAACSVVVFGLAHSYQGPKGVLATGVLGALFTLVVLGLGSLWPAIALHALVDVGQGVVAWLVLRKGGDKGAAVAGLEQATRS
jgi:CAAX protease family protein